MQPRIREASPFAATQSFLVRPTREGFAVEDVELGLVAEAPNLDEAYKALREARQQAISERMALGDTGVLDSIGARTLRGRFLRGMGLLALGCALGMLTASIHGRIQDPLGLVNTMSDRKRAARYVATHFSSLSHALDTLPESRREELRGDVRRFVSAVRPFLLELRPLLEALQEEPASTRSQEPEAR